MSLTCLLYTSDAADERSSVDLGGRRIIKKKNSIVDRACTPANLTNFEYTPSRAYNEHTDNKKTASERQ